jgi:hypothetical protein
LSRHSTSKYRRKNHRHRRSGENTNATKLRSKHRKRIVIPQDYIQPSFDNEIPFDARTMVRDHLYISILGLLCFFPTGIFGLIRAIQAYKMKRSSSIVYWPRLAAIYGRHALRWAILSILIGIMLWTIFIIYHLLREQHPLW